MNKKLFCIVSFIFILNLILPASSMSQSGKPLKIISSWEVDLNNDSKTDIAQLVETSRDIELIVLIKTSKGYNSYLVSTGKRGMNLSYHYGNSLTETNAGKGKNHGKVYKTPGVYLELSQPEGASVAYFWNGKGFTEVWISD